jgi:hypothetical protein
MVRGIPPAVADQTGRSLVHVSWSEAGMASMRMMTRPWRFNKSKRASELAIALECAALST